MSNCEHQLGIAKRLVAFKGSGIRCRICREPVYCEHPFFRSFTEGLGFFLFVPFFALLYFSGKWWPYISSAAGVIMLGLYYVDSKRGRLIKYSLGNELKHTLLVLGAVVAGVIVLAIFSGATGN